jgi:hypothetical protein
MFYAKNTLFYLVIFGGGIHSQKRVFQGFSKGGRIVVIFIKT